MAVFCFVIYNKDMKNKKIKIIILVVLSFIVFIFAFINKNKNNNKNLEEKAKEYCINNGFEYREIQESSGTILKQCKNGDKFIDIIEFYNLKK